MAVLDSKTIAAFRRDGFVMTPSMLTATEVARYGTAVDAEVARRTAGDARAVGEKNRYEQSFVQCMRLWETAADVAPLTFHPKIAEAAAELLGVERLLLWQDQALYKEAGGAATTPHQDSPFWPIGDAPLVSAWIPLVDVTVEMGAMAYVPGSHEVGSLRVVDITHKSDPYDILNDPALQQRQPVILEAQAGSVIWHHGFTVHGAGANASDRTRRAFTVVYIAAGSRRVREWKTFPLERAGVPVGGLIEGEGMPVVWPSPDRIPTPPEQLGETTGPQQRAR